MTRMHWLLPPVLLFGFASVAKANPNCAHSQSWQCRPTSVSGGVTTQAPAHINPQVGNPTGTPVTPLGGFPTDHHNVVLMPQQPPPLQQAQQATPGALPPPTRPPQQVPTLVPPQPPAQQAQQATPGALPPPTRPPQQVLTLVPPQPPAQQAQQLLPIAVPPPDQPSLQSPVLVPPLRPPHPTHQLVLHQNPRPQPITSGHHTGPDKYSLEFIEPGIQNHKVEVYRSRDAQQAVYKDTIPLDAGSYHLRVIGIRDPAYINRQPAP